MTDYWNTPTENVRTTADVVIIGSGPGGSIAAMTLAEAGLEVILLEKGKAMTSANMPHTLRDAVRDWYAEAAFRTTKGTMPCCRWRGLRWYWSIQPFASQPQRLL